MQLHLPHGVFFSTSDTGIASVFIVLSLGGFSDISATSAYVLISGIIRTDDSSYNTIANIML
jgi:hypothetical protein